MEQKIIPALLSDSFAEIEGVVKTLENLATEAQLDIVDGQFAPNKSWPFTAPDPNPEWRHMSALNNRLPLEVDLMVKNPEQYLETIRALGVKRITVHYGSSQDINEVINSAHQLGLQVGLAFTSDTTIAEIEPYVNAVDWIQVMGIRQVGQQAQPYDNRTTDTLNTLRDKHPRMTLAVDGSVNEETIPSLLNAGATRLMVGSAITKVADKKEAYKHLTTLLTN